MPYDTGDEDVKPHVAVEPEVDDGDILHSGTSDDSDEDDGPLAQQLAYNNQRDVRRVRAPREEPVQRAGFPFLTMRLPNYTNKAFTVGELYDLLHADPPGIDLYPAYQREAVWKPERAQSLIHSLVSNIFVPPLLFNSIIRNVNTNKETLVCVDGKQRLTSLMKFMDGEIEMSDDKKRKKQVWVFKKTASWKTTWQEMSEPAREAFRNIKFQAAIYEDLRSDEEHTMFQKIQQGVELSKDEKLKGIDSAFSPRGDSLEKEYLQEPNGTFGRMCDLVRGKGYVALFEIYLWLRNEGTIQEMRYQTPSVILKNLEDPTIAGPSSSEYRFLTDRLSRLRDLTLLTEDDEGTLHKVFSYRPVAPIEFSFLPMIVHHWYQQDNGVLLEIIERFRKMTYDKFAGKIMRNAKVFETLRNWLVAFKLSSLKGTYDVDGKVRQPAGRPRGAHMAGNSRQVSPSSAHSRDGSPPPREVARSKALISAAPQASTQATAHASTSAAVAPRKRPLAEAPAAAAKRAANGAKASASQPQSMFSAKPQKPLPRPVPQPRLLPPDAQKRKDDELQAANQAKLLKIQGSTYGQEQPPGAWGQRPLQTMPLVKPNPSLVNDWVKSQSQLPTNAPFPSQLLAPATQQPSRVSDPPSAWRPQPPPPNAHASGSKPASQAPLPTGWAGANPAATASRLPPMYQSRLPPQPPQSQPNQAAGVSTDPRKRL